MIETMADLRPKIGDRYLYGDDTHYNLWEVTSVNTITIIESSITRFVGRNLAMDDMHPGGMKFIGNFSKSNNFKIIYDILNETNGASE
jgi:hypothetical protein